MPSRAPEYIAVVRRHCGKFIAGPTVSAFGLIAAFIAWSLGADASTVKWIAWVSAAIFVLSIFPAQYGAWKEERERSEKFEAELNAKADIRGSVTLQTARSLPDTTTSRLTYEVYCANYGRGPCQISMILFDMVRKDSQEHHPFRMALPDGDAKIIGHGERFTCKGKESIPLPLEDLNQFRITVSLIDSLGTIYPDIETRIVYADLGGEVAF